MALREKAVVPVRALRQIVLFQTDRAKTRVKFPGSGPKGTVTAALLSRDPRNALCSVRQITSDFLFMFFVISKYRPLSKNILQLCIKNVFHEHF